jgi:hypothetical protein
MFASILSKTVLAAQDVERTAEFMNGHRHSGTCRSHRPEPRSFCSADDTRQLLFELRPEEGQGRRRRVFFAPHSDSGACFSSSPPSSTSLHKNLIQERSMSFADSKLNDSFSKTAGARAWRPSAETPVAYDDAELEGLPPASDDSFNTLSSLSYAGSTSSVHAVPRTYTAGGSTLPGHPFPSAPSNLSISSLSSARSATLPLPGTPGALTPSSSVLASSPAARFLAAFGSPATPPPAPAPDAAGQPVPGHPGLVLGSLLARGRR